LKASIALGSGIEIVGDGRDRHHADESHHAVVVVEAP
jgi:hypothetical protein